MISRLSLLLPALIAAILLHSAAGAAVDNSRFQEANAAYSRNDFATAIAGYEALISDHGYSAGLLYNLANSYAQAGMVGKAVLNYERARKLSPNDSDIIGNLQLVRTANGLFTREATWPEHILHILSMNQWIALGELALVALTAVLLLSLRFRIPTRALAVIAICCVAVMTTAVISTLELRHEWAGAVVISESRLQISPFDGAATAGNIQQGRMVYPGRQHEGYVFVEDETGRKGWLQRSVLEPVIPSRTSGGG